MNNLYNAEDVIRIDKLYLQMTEIIDYQSEIVKRILDFQAIDQNLKQRFLTQNYFLKQQLLISKKLLQKNISKTRMFEISFCDLEIGLILNDDYFNYIVQYFNEEKISIYAKIKQEVEAYQFKSNDKVENLLKDYKLKLYQIEEKFKSKPENIFQKVENLMKARQVMISNDKFKEFIDIAKQQQIDFLKVQYEEFVHHIYQKQNLPISKVKQINQYFNLDQYTNVPEKFDFKQLFNKINLLKRNIIHFTQIKETQNRVYNYLIESKCLIYIIIKSNKYPTLYFVNYYSHYENGRELLNEFNQIKSTIYFFRIHPLIISMYQKYLQQLYYCLKYIQKCPVTSTFLYSFKGQKMFELFTEQHYHELDKLLTREIQEEQDALEFVKNMLKQFKMKDDIQLIFEDEFIQKFKQQIELYQFHIAIIERKDFEEKHKANQNFQNLIISENGIVQSVFIAIPEEKKYMNQGKEILGIDNIYNIAFQVQPIPVNIVLFYLKIIFKMNHAKLIKGLLQKNIMVMSAILKYINF